MVRLIIPKVTSLREDALFTEPFVEALLIAGIAGAGLVLAAFSLGVSKAEDILNAAAASLGNDVKKLGETQVTATTPRAEIKRRVRMEYEIMEKQELPAGLDLVFNLGAFLGFTLLSSLSFVWLYSEPSRSQVEPLLVLFFAASILFFVLSGGPLIWNIHKVVSNRWKELKKNPRQQQRKMEVT